MMYDLSYGYQSVHYVVMYGHLFYFISMFKMFGCTRYLSLERVKPRRLLLNQGKEEENQGGSY